MHFNICGRIVIFRSDQNKSLPGFLYLVPENPRHGNFNAGLTCSHGQAPPQNAVELLTVAGHQSLFLP